MARIRAIFKVFITFVVCLINLFAPPNLRPTNGGVSFAYLQRVCYLCDVYPYKREFQPTKPNVKELY